MGLLDDLNAAMSPAQYCKFGRWLNSQTDDYQHEILDALQADFPTRVIWRVLTQKNGSICSESVFERHRNGGCSCDFE